MAAGEDTNDDEIRIGFIGGAASTIATASYLVRNLKADAAFKDKHIDIYVLDRDGLNAGPAYRFQSGAFVLNQPAGDEMNPFRNGGDGLPPSFMSWGKFDRGVFPPRGSFGEYLRDVAATLPRQDAGGNVTVHEIRSSVTAVDETPARLSGHRYLAKTSDHKIVPLDGFVLATGHSFSPRLEHARYLAAYSGKDYEQKLVTAATDKDDKIFIGSGASMTDNICALEHFGNRSKYQVFSPYGNTSWAYVPDTPRPSENALHTYVTALADAQGPTSAITVLMRRAIKAAAGDGIAPQYLLSAALAEPGVAKSPNLLKVIEAFYGNPLSPERFSIVSNLERDGRIDYDLHRVDGVVARGNHLRVESGNEAVLCTGYAIDCTVVHRGIRNENGAIANPLIAQLIDNGIISVARKNRNEIDPLTAPEKLVFAVGPITNAFKNGIETFAPSYQLVAAELTTRLRERAARPRAVFNPSYRVKTDFSPQPPAP